VKNYVKFLCSALLSCEEKPRIGIWEDYSFIVIICTLNLQKSEVIENLDLRYYHAQNGANLTLFFNGLFSLVTGWKNGRPMSATDFDRVVELSRA